jgi:hypothetical protein
MRVQVEGMELHKGALNYLLSNPTHHPTQALRISLVILLYVPCIGVNPEIINNSFSSTL